MANQATTTYKVTGTRKAVNNLWNTFQSMEVNNKNIWLSDLAKHYGIDYEMQNKSASEVISIGLSMRKTKTYVCFLLRRKQHGMPVMTSSLRLTDFLAVS